MSIVSSYCGGVWGLESCILITFPIFHFVNHIDTPYYYKLCKTDHVLGEGLIFLSNCKRKFILKVTKVVEVSC